MLVGEAGNRGGAGLVIPFGDVLRRECIALVLRADQTRRGALALDLRDHRRVVQRGMAGDGRKEVAGFLLLRHHRLKLREGRAGLGGLDLAALLLDDLGQDGHLGVHGVDCCAGDRAGRGWAHKGRNGLRAADNRGGERPDRRAVAHRRAVGGRGAGGVAQDPVLRGHHAGSVGGARAGGGAPRRLVVARRDPPGIIPEKRPSQDGRTRRAGVGLRRDRDVPHRANRRHHRAGGVGREAERDRHARAARAGAVRDRLLRHGDHGGGRAAWPVPARVAGRGGDHAAMEGWAVGRAGVCDHYADRDVGVAALGVAGVGGGALVPRADRAQDAPGDRGQPEQSLGVGDGGGGCGGRADRRGVCVPRVFAGRAGAGDEARLAVDPGRFDVVCAGALGKGTVARDDHAGLANFKWGSGQR